MRTEPAVVRRRLRIRGRVHGVWFRDSARREASRLGVAGWVRNVADGSVEAVAEGNIQAVTDFAAWCAKGPPKATVLAVDMTEEPAVGLRGFEIMSDAPAPIGRV